MNVNERFLKILHNVMLSDKYTILVDGIESRIYEHLNSNSICIGIGEPVCKDFNLNEIRDLSLSKNYAFFYLPDGEEKMVEIVKHVDFNELEN